MVLNDAILATNGQAEVIPSSDHHSFDNSLPAVGEPRLFSQRKLLVRLRVWPCVSRRVTHVGIRTSNSWVVWRGGRPSKSDANFYRKLLLKVVAPAHSLDAALSIHNALLARVEGVAIAANLYSQNRFGAARLENIAARASYRRFHKLRMYICFHSYF